MAKLIAACLVLGALSLALPFELSYDPWAWLVWGRELASPQLTFETVGGPSWKPLPVALTTLLWPLGELDLALPPLIWMATARAGALLAVALAFRLAHRLSGGGVAGIAAGVLAAAALCLLPDWYQFVAHGSEAPAAIALMLWALERHLDDRRDQAFVLGTLACLLRPELGPFLLAYGAFLWLKEPRRRPLVAGLGLVLAAAWLVPEWIGAGNPLDGGEQARSEPHWSLSHAESPWQRSLLRVHNHAGVVVELLAAAAVVSALATRRPVVLILAAAGAAEASLFVAMTQLGFSGNPRYVLPALAVACVLAGVGLAAVLRARRAWVAVAGAVVLALGVPATATRIDGLRAEAREVGRRVELHRDLATAVQRVGGPAAVNRLGPASVNRGLHTRLAWELGRPIEEVESSIGHGVIFESSRRFLAGEPGPRTGAGAHVPVARVGSWRVYLPEWVYISFAGISQRTNR